MPAKATLAQPTPTSGSTTESCGQTHRTQPLSCGAPPHDGPMAAIPPATPGERPVPSPMPAA
eukprot:5364721-Amphidinium_carterae.2